MGNTPEWLQELRRIAPLRFARNANPSAGDAVLRLMIQAGLLFDVRPLHLLDGIIVIEEPPCFDGESDLDPTNSVAAMDIHDRIRSVLMRVETTLANIQKIRDVGETDYAEILSLLEGTEVSGPWFGDGEPRARGLAREAHVGIERQWNDFVDDHRQ